MRGCMRGERKRTTRSCRWVKPAEDLVNRDFAASRADKVWVADITYIPTEEGFLYLAFILDVHSRRMVGMGDGEPSENRARRECPDDGRMEEKARSGTRPPQRPGKPR